MTQLVKIETETGSEFHSTYGSQGHIFVLENNEEIPIYKKFKDVSQDWDSDKHCKRVKSVYEVPSGTILKAKFKGLGKTKGKQEQLIKINSEANYIIFKSDLTAYCGYYISGKFEII